MNDDGIRVTPLFVGLTRPSMILGVSMDFAVVNFTILGLGQMFRADLLLYFIVLFLILHVVGYVACSKEPRCVKLYVLKIAKFSKAFPTKRYYGANSYLV